MPKCSAICLNTVKTLTTSTFVFLCKQPTFPDLNYIKQVPWENLRLQQHTFYDVPVAQFTVYFITGF